MGTLVAMVLVLAGPWLTARLLGRPRPVRVAAARIGVALLLMMTGAAHFVATDSFAAMLPPWTPLRREAVLATGVLEIALAAAYLVPRYRRAAAVMIVLMLAAFLPVNISAALRRVDVGGHAWGSAYLLVRLPLQFAVAAWVWRFGVDRHQTGSDAGGTR